MIHTAFEITTLDTGLRCVKCKTIVVARIVPDVAIQADELDGDLNVHRRVEDFHCFGCGRIHVFLSTAGSEQTLKFVYAEIERLVDEERQRRSDERRKKLTEVVEVVKTDAFKDLPD